ncbi:MAG: AAA family ATPase [Planctomycetaceae bacterium]|nr:AAA family ATPase [Planctomycetaceae bacterium]
MKITHLEIDRFGVWRNLSLPLSSPELNVVFGPNEAGKTTLMRFLRGVLFGYADRDSLNAIHPASGMLEVEHEGGNYLVQRTGDVLSITGDRELEEEDAQRFLKEMLGNVTKDVFDNVCCFGLDELQQLSVLSGEEIVEKLFGVSLGHKGKFILQAIKDAERRKQEMTLGSEHKISIRRLITDHDRLTRQLDELGEPRKQLSGLKEQLLSVEQRITNLQKQQKDSENEQEGYQFLQRVHGPWSQVRNLEAKLESLPVVDDFPEEGIARLDEIESDLDVLLEERSALRDKLRRLESELTQAHESQQVLDELPAIRVLLDQANQLDGRQQIPASDREELRRLEESLNLKMKELGDNWTLERLGRLHLSPEQQQKLSHVAQDYEKFLKRRARTRRKIESLSKSTQKEQQELERQSSKWQGQSGAQMLERTERLLNSSRDRERFSMRAEQLDDRISLLEQQQQSLIEAEPLPKGVQYLLTGFTVAGAMLAILGIWQGVNVSGLAGAVYVLLGLTCGGLGFALQWHFSSEQGETLGKLQKEVDQLRQQRFEVTTKLGTLGQSEQPADLSALTSQLTTYQKWIDREAEWETRRREASQLRASLQELRRDLANTRERWLQTLRDIGLNETVKIADGWKSWNAALELKSIQHQIMSLREKHSQSGELRQVFDSSVLKVQEKITRSPIHSSTHEIIEEWRDNFETWQQLWQRKQEVAHEQRQIQSRLEELESDIKSVRSKHSQLLAAGGAHDRQSFDERALWYRERRELLELMEMAREELDRAIGEQRHLAIFEDDLLEFNAGETQERLQELTHQLGKIESKLTTSYEKRGELRQQRDSILNDRRDSRLRQEVAEVEEQIKQQCERWLGIDRAEQAISHIKFTLEREQRPATLQRAEQYFRMLTGGRYQRVWAPLGEHDLHVEDHAGLARQLNELSGGTREQLLLSLRLALVEEQRKEGIHLPFILDDILVNFDETRVASAMETLQEFAQSGTQTLLLTCHSHLAEAFSNQGVSVTNLPTREHQTERLAG